MKKLFLSLVIFIMTFFVSITTYAQQHFLGVFQYPEKMYSGNHYTSLSWQATCKVDVVENKLVVRITDYDISVALGSNYKLGNEMIPWNKFQHLMSKFDHYTASFIAQVQYKNGKTFEARVEYNALKNISSQDEGYFAHLSEFPNRTANPLDFKILKLELYWSNQQVDVLMEKKLKK